MSLRNVKNILIGFTEEEERPSSALSFGLSLACEAGAHATALSASVKLNLPHAAVSDLAAGLVAAENERMLELADAAADTVRRRALSDGVPCTVEAVQLRHAELVGTFATLCRVHDLTVVDADADMLSVDRTFIEQALFSSGRPVIVVPHGANTFRAERVMIAWDGSARAARALNDALPFLQNAGTVEIVCVTGEKELSKSVPGAEIAPHLVRHGIQAVVTDLVAQNGDAGETLLTHARMTRADMIVMGAFVHSRLRQMILGGVTQSLLKAAPAPLFLSH